MSQQQSLADIGFNVVSRAHRAIVHLSSGRVLGSAFGMPVSAAPGATSRWSSANRVERPARLGVTSRLREGSCYAR